MISIMHPSRRLLQERHSPYVRAPEDSPNDQFPLVDAPSNTSQLNVHSPYIGAGLDGELEKGPFSLAHER